MSTIQRASVTSGGTGEVAADRGEARGQQAAGRLPGAPTLLFLPAPIAVRMLALWHIRRIRAVLKEFVETGEAERLHELRVAVRRLRSLFRAYPEDITGSVRKKDRRRLQQVAAETAVLRDLDVRLAWIDDVVLESHEFAAAERLRARNAEARVDEVVAVRQRLEADLGRLMRRLRKRLRRYTFDLAAGAAESRPGFAVALADTLLRLRHQLEDRLQRLSAANDEPAVHATRIAAKRLRYALEPVAAMPAAGAVTAELVRLQELLGRFLDLGGAIVAIDREHAAAHRGDDDVLVAGLQGLLSRARAERAESSALVRSDWVQDLGRRRLAGLDRVLEELVAGADETSPFPP